MKDQEIIALFLAKDERAINELNTKYQSYMKYIAMHILHNPEDVAEIINEVELKIWNTICEQKPTSLKAYVGMVTKQLSINRLAKNTSQKNNLGQSLASIDDLGWCIPSYDSYVEDQVIFHMQINDFLRSLKKRDRIIFVKKYWYRENSVEIATDLNIKSSTVRMSLLKTRNKFIEYFKEAINS